MKQPLQAPLILSQEWYCTVCNATRPYGLGVPERHTAWLLCDGECAPKHTLHRFKELRSVPAIESKQWIVE